MRGEVRDNPGRTSSAGLVRQRAASTATEPSPVAATLRTARIRKTIEGLIRLSPIAPALREVSISCELLDRDGAQLRGGAHASPTCESRASLARNGPTLPRRYHPRWGDPLAALPCGLGRPRLRHGPRGRKRTDSRPADDVPLATQAVAGLLTSGLNAALLIRLARRSAIPHVLALALVALPWLAGLYEGATGFQQILKLIADTPDPAKNAFFAVDALKDFQGSRAVGAWFCSVQCVAIAVAAAFTAPRRTAALPKRTAILLAVWGLVIAVALIVAAAGIGRPGAALVVP